MTNKTGRLEEMLLDRNLKPIPVLSLDFSQKNSLVFTTSALQRIPTNAPENVPLVGGGLYLVQAFETSPASTNCVYLHYAIGISSVTVTDDYPMIGIAKSSALNNPVPLILKMIAGQTHVAFKPDAAFATFGITVVMTRLL